MYELKVLHAWSVAGVAEIIAKYMDRDFETRSRVLVRRDADKFGFNQRPLSSGPYGFALRCLLQSRNHDLVQVHGWDVIVPWLRRFSSTPIVLTYHNSNIADEWERRRKYWSKADKRIIATPGVADEKNGALYIPEPVDTDLFSDKGEHVPGTALHFEYGATSEAKELAKDHGLELAVWDRDKNPIRNAEMPNLLNKYEYYIDIKRPYKTSLPIIKATGKTCLEALACGCKVIRWDGRVLEGFPEQNKPETVVKSYFDLYTSLTRAG